MPFVRSLFFGLLCFIGIFTSQKKFIAKLYLFMGKHVIEKKNLQISFTENKVTLLGLNVHFTFSQLLPLPCYWNFSTVLWLLSRTCQMNTNSNVGVRGQKRHHLFYSPLISLNWLDVLFLLGFLFQLFYLCVCACSVSSFIKEPTTWRSWSIKIGIEKKFSKKKKSRTKLPNLKKKRKLPVNISFELKLRIFLNKFK